MTFIYADDVALLTENEKGGESSLIEMRKSNNRINPVKLICRNNQQNKDVCLHENTNTCINTGTWQLYRRNGILLPCINNNVWRNNHTVLFCEKYTLHILYNDRLHKIITEGRVQGKTYTFQYGNKKWIRHVCRPIQ